ncbi:Alpha/Beta hydrolase protein [Syncephalis fuscata]|nr:Alpha/Beta hydrolase protein [Syncephalis fuscata]
MHLSSADYYIHSLPGLPSNVTIRQYSGHIPLDDQHGTNLFFWLVTKQEFQSKDRLVIWFNGGSMDGVFMENGPYRPRKDLQLDINPYSWHKYASVLFVDQPVGTGFSYSESKSNVHDLPSVARDMRLFLKKFMQIFPEYSNSEIYLAGESYAGVYIPYIAKEFVDASEKPNTDFKVNLAGLALGNGWIDSYTIYMSYVEFAEKYNLMSGESLEQAKQYTKECDLEYKKYGEKIKYDKCEKIFSTILDSSIQIDKAGNKTCLNIYDKRLRDPYPQCGMAWPPILPYVYSYLKRKDVVKAIHAEKKPTEWIECDNTVLTSLERDRSNSSHLLLPDLLKKMRVLFFVGDEDTLCNRIGLEHTIERMTWNGKKGFQDTPQFFWKIENKSVGLWQEDRNVTYARIFHGSHMLAVDNSLEAFDMMNRFMGIENTSSASEILTASAVISKLEHNKNGESTGTVANLFWVVGVIAVLGLFATYFVHRQRRRSARKPVIEEEALMFSSELEPIRTESNEPESLHDN